MNSTDSVSTTGSFQNQPTSGTRKRGIAAVLSDSTNMLGSSCTKRTCKAKAEHKIHVQSTTKSAPRGNPKADVKARFSEASDTTPPTLYEIFHHNRHTLNAGMQCISSFLQTTTSMEVQKAVAITVMGTAMMT